MKEVKKMYERPSMNRILVQIEDGFNPGSIPGEGPVVTGDTRVDIHEQGGFYDYDNDDDRDIDMTDKTTWE